MLRLLADKFVDDEFVDNIVGEFVDELVDEFVDQFVDELIKQGNRSKQ